MTERSLLPGDEGVGYKHTELFYGKLTVSARPNWTYWILLAAVAEAVDLAYISQQLDSQNIILPTSIVLQRPPLGIPSQHISRELRLMTEVFGKTSPKWQR